MCGFAGLLTPPGARSGEALEAFARRMVAPIAHRGPDDEGVWADAGSGVALGFRRLAIIDLSTHGHQPMRSASGRFTVVFNGEIYNHGALRAELEACGWRFRGRSDTEVLVAAFERWGVAEAVKRFVGMFAIGVWDAEERSLSLVRDRLGIKPLFVYARPGLVTFGSELKALAAGPEFDRTLDESALAAYLRYLYVPAPLSIFRHVRKLLPGHILTITDAAAPLPDPEPFWSVPAAARGGAADPFRGTEDDAIDELERLLADAVRLRLQADVPVGALLSGGVDSSTVVALAQAASSRPTKTFTIAFPDAAEHDEARHAARVASYLGTDHTELSLTGDEALAVVPELPDLFDEPLADPSQIPTYLISGLARRTVVVALSGDGGDEVFAGYNRYLEGERLIERLARMPAPVRQLAGAAVRSLSPEAWDRTYRAVQPVLPARLHRRLPGEKAGKLGELLRRDSPAEMYRALLSAWQHPERVVSSGARAHGSVERLLEAGCDLPILDWMMLADQATYLADDLLAKVDRASMAVSLEVRVPILDHRVVELGWRLPRSLKVRGRQGKWILRQVLYRHVPPELVERPKVGFTVPIGPWLRGPLRPWAEELLFGGGIERHGFLRGSVIRDEWRRFQERRSNAALALWAVLVFEAWSDRWLS